MTTAPEHDKDSAAAAAPDPDTAAADDRPDFAAWLTRYRDGALNRELSEAFFGDLVEGLESTGKKKGSVGLVLTVERQKMEGAVMVSDHIDRKKIPVAERPEAADMFFVGEHGALVDEHPRQRTFGYDLAPQRRGDSR